MTSPLLIQPAHKASNREVFTSWSTGTWRLRLSSSRTVIAGMLDRSGDPASLRTSPAFTRGVIEADQVHGASLAAVEPFAPSLTVIPGCDALVTQTPKLGLIIRSADCLPIFLWDPTQRVVGVAHAGWRGLAKELPMRLVAFVQRRYHSRPRDLVLGIGPSIRSCCYEVGPEFAPSFGPFMQRQGDRLTCDLIACAKDQLIRAGVSAGRIVDAGCCTACDTTRWYSLRKEGEQGGRLFSFIGLAS